MKDVVQYHNQPETLFFARTAGMHRVSRLRNSIGCSRLLQCLSCFPAIESTIRTVTQSRRADRKQRTADIKEPSNMIIDQVGVAASRLQLVKQESPSFFARGEHVHVSKVCRMNDICSFNRVQG